MNETLPDSVRKWKGEPFLPWSLGEVRYDDLTGEWTVSVFDSRGGQVFHHRAYWRPTDQDLELIVRSANGTKRDVSGKGGG